MARSIGVIYSALLIFTTFIWPAQALADDISIDVPTVIPEGAIQPGDDLLPAKDSWYNWRPSGENPHMSSRNCTSSAITRLLRGESRFELQFFGLQKHLEKCETEMNREIDDLGEVLRLQSMGLPVANNPYIRSVLITLAGGIKVTGYLGIKPGIQKRPLVIYQCGLFCNASDSATHRNMIAHLFDESPFHILALGSVTGTRYQVDNGIPALGGFDEGRQILEIARLLRHPRSSYAELISGVHLIGLSLGGHAALYASLYDSFNVEPVLDSVVAMCPVVNLQNSMSDLFSNRIIGYLAAELTAQQMRSIANHVPLIKKNLDLSKPVTRGDLLEALSQAASTHYEQTMRLRPWNLEPFKGQRIQSRDDWWRWNRFELYEKYIQRPTLVISSTNDRIVYEKNNARLLRSSRNPNLKVLNFKRGDHCGFSAANGWSNMSALLREFFMSHSSEKVDESGTARIDDLFQSKKWRDHFALRPGEAMVGYKWRVRPRATRVQLELTMLRLGGRAECYWDAPAKAQADCYRTVTVNLPMARLPISFTPTLSTADDANRFERWLNTRLLVLDEKGEELQESRGTPTWLSVN